MNREGVKRERWGWGTYVIVLVGAWDGLDALVDELHHVLLARHVLAQLLHQLVHHAHLPSHTQTDRQTEREQWESASSFLTRDQASQGSGRANNPGDLSLAS